MQHIIFGDKTRSLDIQRFLTYNRLEEKRNLVPASLPPTVAATTQHVLRVCIL